MQKCEDICVSGLEKVKKQERDLGYMIKSDKQCGEIYDEESKRVIKDAVVTARLRLYGVLQTNFMKFRRNVQALPVRRKVHRDTLNSVISCVRRQTVHVFVIWLGVEKLWRIQLRTGFLRLLTPSLPLKRKFKALTLRMTHQCLVSILLYSNSLKYSKEQYLKSSIYLSRTLKRVQKRKLKFSLSRIKQSIVPIKSNWNYSTISLISVLIVSILMYFILNIWVG